MTTKDVETSHAPIKSVLSVQLQEYGSLIHSLLTSVIRCSSSATSFPSESADLSSTNTNTTQSPQEITQAFLELDKRLKVSVSTRTFFLRLKFPTFPTKSHH